jgi:hypothetical protein
VVHFGRLVFASAQNRNASQQCRKKDAMAVKGLRRHHSVTTTRKHYLKEVPEVMVKGTEKAEGLCTDRATAAASRPNLVLKNMMPAGGI